MKRNGYIWKAFLSLLVVVFVSGMLIGCSPEPENPKEGDTKTEHPTGDDTKTEHPTGDDTKTDDTKTEHPKAEHPK